MNMPNRIPGPVDDEAKPLILKEECIRKEDDKPAEDRVSSNERILGQVKELAEPFVDTDEEVCELPAIATVETAKKNPWSIVFWLLVLTVFSWLSYDVWVGLSNIIQQSKWFGIFLITLTVALLAAFGWAIRREYRAIQETDHLAERQENIVTTQHPEPMRQG